MATIDRKSSIRKAPAADVVESLTQQSATPPVLAMIEPTPSDTQTGGVRPGPGRPRSKRRMEPFSSKIEINLRDSLDDYLAMQGMTVVDFLDEAFRDRINKK